MTTLIKLGGSLVTDKSRSKSFRQNVVARLAAQLRHFRSLDEERRIVIGHGSGSFGHHEAQKHNTVQGVYSDEDRLGFAQVGAVATELSLLLLNEFLTLGLPAMRFQPSTTLVANNQEIASFDSRALSMALEQGLLPLVHGDIALDHNIGGTIMSTESIFAHLVEPLSVREIILLGEVDGVFDQTGDVIPVITPQSLPNVLSSLKGSSGIDVTGGMLQKVQTMVELVQKHPSLNVVIGNGNKDDILIDLLVNQCNIGTRICAQDSITRQ